MDKIRFAFLILVNVLLVGCADVTSSGNTGTQTPETQTPEIEDNFYNFKDITLINKVVDLIGKEKSEISLEDLKAIKIADFKWESGKKIENLSGIEQLEGLVELHLSGNNITNIDVFKSILDKNNSFINSIEYINIEENGLEISGEDSTTQAGKNWYDIVLKIIEYIDSDSGRKIVIDYEIGNKIIADKDAFTDENFKQAIVDEVNFQIGNSGIKKSNFDDLTSEDFLKVESLIAVEKNIESIEGIQYLWNLERLNLRNNKLKDLSPLMRRMNEEEPEDLNPRKNKLSLPNLQYIDLENNGLHIYTCEIGSQGNINWNGVLYKYWLFPGVIRPVYNNGNILVPEP